LAEAFERPVRPSENGFMAESLQRMASHYAALVRDFDLEDQAALYHRVDMEGLPLVRALSSSRGDEGAEAPTLKADAAGKLSDLWAFLRDQTNQPIAAA
jgi:hypothetical protein